jgi:hypothetical protein
LIHQTVSEWEAIVGIDVVTTTSTHANKSTSTTPQQQRLIVPTFVQDPRIHYHEIVTSHRFRGRKRNGSGQVRNAAIQQYATADWVAFVDDDDTVSPYYVQTLLDSIREEEEEEENDNDDENSYDNYNYHHYHHKSTLHLIVFRMQGYPQYSAILPPFNSRVLGIGDVGISFAVRRNVFTLHNITFVPHPSEDYWFVQHVHEYAGRNGGGGGVRLSTCVVYYIRRTASTEPPVRCGLEPHHHNLTFTGVLGEAAIAFKHQNL